MNPIKRIMICLDLTEIDDLLIQYAYFLCQQINDIEQILFFHNIKFDSTEELSEVLTQLDKPLDELVNDSIEEKIAANSNATSVDYELLIREQNSTPLAIAEATTLNKVDMVLVGKKIAYKGTGLATEKLLRIPTYTAVTLLLPETASHRLQQILVPIDFSKSGARNLEKAAYLKEKTGATVSCQYVFSIPSLYFPSMVVRDMEKPLRQKAQGQWIKFKQQLSIPQLKDLDCDLSFNWEKNIVQTIYDHATRMRKDLIIISIKNKPTFFIGRVAIQLIQYDLHIPLMVIKRDS